MRKPVSKNALRRAFDKVVTDGQIQCSIPINTVVDHIWHDLERQSYNGARKKPTSRRTLRGAGVAETGEVDLPEP